MFAKHKDLVEAGLGGCSKRGQTGQQYRCPGRLKNVSDRREFTAIFGLYRITHVPIYR